MPAAPRATVAPAIVKRLRGICLALRQLVEEPAWVGTRWRARRQTFADVVMVDPG